MKIDSQTLIYHLLQLPLYLIRIAWGCIKWPILFLDWILPEVNTSNRHANQSRRDCRKRLARLRPTLMDIMISHHYKRQFNKRRKPNLFEK